MKKKIITISILCLFLFVLGIILKKLTNLFLIQITIFNLVLLILFIIRNKQNKPIKIVSLFLYSFNIFILLIGTLPMFRLSPDMGSFKHTKTIEYYLASNTDGGNLNIKTDGIEQNIEIKQGEQKIFPRNRQTIEINLLSNKTHGETHFFIQFPNQTTIVIKKGTQAKITKESDYNYTIENISGYIEYFEAENNSGFKFIKSEKKTDVDFIGSDLIKKRKEEQLSYVRQRLGGEIMQNKTIIKANRILLEAGSKIWPNLYSQNIKNYQEYKDIFGWKDEINSNYKSKSKEIGNSILNNIKDSFSETRMLK